MKYITLMLLGVSFLFNLEALEYEKQFENQHICVTRLKIMPGEEIGLHYDLYPSMVLALHGGILTRIENDSSTTNVEFANQQITFRPAETEEKMHKTINNQSTFIELVIVQFKTNSSGNV